MSKKLSELTLALMRSQDLTQYEAEEIIDELRERVKYGEDPEEVLFEEGLEPDYVFELI